MSWYSIKKIEFMYSEKVFFIKIINNIKKKYFVFSFKRVHISLKKILHGVNSSKTLQRFKKSYMQT